MRTLLTLTAAGAVLLFATGTVAAPKARVFQYGLYAAEASAADGPAKYAHLETTRRVPLRVGVRFGFCAELAGLEVEGKYTLTEIVRHPVITDEKGIESAGWNVPRMVRVLDGKGIWCGGHVFTKPSELVPGTWRFTVGDSDADLIVEQFDAVAPQ